MAIKFETGVADEDASVAKFSVDDGDGVAYEVVLSAAEIEQALHSLSNARAVMQPEIPFDFQTIEVRDVPNPTWKIPAYTDDKHRVLLMRHPAFGWIGFRVPQDEANAIAEWLTKEVEDRPSSVTPNRRGPLQ